MVTIALMLLAFISGHSFWLFNPDRGELKTQLINDIDFFVALLEALHWIRKKSSPAEPGECGACYTSHENYLDYGIYDQKSADAPHSKFAPWAWARMGHFSKEFAFLVSSQYIFTLVSSTGPYTDTKTNAKNIYIMRDSICSILKHQCWYFHAVSLVQRSNTCNESHVLTVSRQRCVLCYM